MATVSTIPTGKFLASAKPLSALFVQELTGEQLAGVKEYLASKGIAWVGETAVGVKDFSTGSVGWNASVKLPVEVAGHRERVQVGINLTVVGSKERRAEEQKGRLSAA